MRIFFAFEAIVLCVLDPVGLGTTIVIARVVESNLAALSILAYLFRVVDTVRCFSHILGNLLVTNNTLPVMLYLRLGISLLRIVLSTYATIITIALVVQIITVLDKRVFVDAVLV